MVAHHVTGLEAHVRIRRTETFELDVDVSAPPGQTVAVVGPSGAGKSTLVEAIAGVLPIDAGSVHLGGRRLDVPHEGVFVPSEDRRCGVVFQDYALFPHLDVRANVAFGLRSRGMRRRDADRVADGWIERVGLEGLEATRPGDLSGGQRQRVALARALASEPDLLLLDEPLSALDVATRSALRRDLAAHLRGFEGPRIVITHDPTEAFLLADRIHVLEAGTITQSGSPDDIRRRPRTPYAAHLGGINLATGRASGGAVEVGDHVVYIADRSVAGDVVLTIDPSAVSVHADRPEGSPRNAWRTTIGFVEPLGDVTRLQTGDPLPLAIDVTSDAARELALVPGAAVWVSVKATEIVVSPGPA